MAESGAIRNEFTERADAYSFGVEGRRRELVIQR
jgi:hypothetical protein